MSTQALTDAAGDTVVDAGVGLGTIHEFRRLGLSMRVFEAGTDLGGT